MLLAFSFNLATLFKQSISSGSTSNVLSLSFHPINFTIFIWSVVMYIYGPNKAYHSSNDNSKWLLLEIWRDSIHSICNNKSFFFLYIYYSWWYIPWRKWCDTILLFTITYIFHLSFVHSKHITIFPLIKKRNAICTTYTTVCDNILLCLFLFCTSHLIIMERNTQSVVVQVVILIVVYIAHLYKESDACKFLSSEQE